MQTLMKCHLMWHFIWLFTVSQRTCLSISRLKRVICKIGVSVAETHRTCTAISSTLDCRFREHEFHLVFGRILLFNPGSTPYFCGDWSCNIFYSFDWFKKGWCQSQATYLSTRSICQLLSLACQGKVWLDLTDYLDITVVVDWDVKSQTKHKIEL